MVINIRLPDCWEKVSLGDVLSYIGNGLTNKQNMANDGYPVTRIETISDDCINVKKVGYVNTLTNDKIAKYRLCYGDILVSHINSEPQLGRAVIYEGKPEFLLHGMNLLRIRADTRVLDPFFLNFIFRFYRNRSVFVALASRSVGQASINQSRMKSLMIPLPPLSEQRAIAHTLETIQAAKFTRQREIALERERKAALMDYLFSHGTKGEPRKQTGIGEIPESWTIQTFGDCLKEVKSKKVPFIPKRDYQESGQFPIIDQGAAFIAGWTDSTISVIFDDLPVIIFGDHTRIFKYVDFPFAVGAQGTQILYPNDNVLDARFFYYALLDLKVPNKGYNRHYKYLREFSIPCPSLPEQQQISNILQAIDKKTASLEQEVELLDELFHAMLEELMTGKRSATPLIEDGEIQ